MIKMLVTDLDNTLVRGDKTISDFAVSVLRRCRERGITVAYATARSIQASEKYVKRFRPDAFIGYGGALAQAGGLTVRRFAIPADVSSRLINESLITPGVTVIHAVNEFAAHTNVRGINEADAESQHYEYHDFINDGGASYLKITLTSNNPNAVARIASGYPALDMLRYTGEDLYRFAMREAVKWNAVLAVAEHFGFGAESCAAFGDDVNDYEMIKKCGVGIAVSNAIPEVKAAARHICGSCDEDGVAEWLINNVLSPRATR